MQISSASGAMLRYTVQRDGSNGKSGGFADLIASSVKGEVAPFPSDAKSPLKSGYAPDFRNMTSADVKAEAQSMYDRGEIDLNTLGVMQIAANRDDDSGSGDGGKFDFTAKIESIMSFETQSGHRSSTLSPYSTYENILSKITSNSGANRVG